MCIYLLWGLVCICQSDVKFMYNYKTNWNIENLAVLDGFKIWPLAWLSTLMSYVLIWVLGQQSLKMFHNTHTVQYTKLQCIVGEKMADLDSQGLKCGNFFTSDSVHGNTFHVCWMLECNSAKATLGRFFVFELGFVFACMAPGLCDLINS